jgi:outer membrane protein assembly factor BamB
MSVSENPFVSEMASSVVMTGKSLRWWPAAGLLGLMGALKLMPSLMESPPLPVLMVGFMGPAGVSVLIMAWWMFASRAAWKEKLTGFIGVLVLAVISALLVHPSMKGMSAMLYQIPVGFALFAFTLVLLASRPSLRLWSALVVAALGFGVWDLVQMNGVTGRFAPEFAWRWSPTAEQEYLKTLADRGGKSTEATEGSTDAVSRSTSEWSDFRGPQRDGKQPGIILDEDWTANPPRSVWRSKIGPGWSSFTVAGNRLFTQEQRDDKEAVVCLNAETGSILWAHENVGRFWESVAGAGPRSTPTIGDEGLFALGANGDLTCLNPINGDVIWHRDLQTDAGRKPPMWGFASSPLVHNGIVVVHAGGPGDKGVLAYDSKTGNLKWSVASGDHSYSSPHLASFDGVEGILMQTNAGLQFLNNEDGSLIWRHEWPVENYRVTQPLLIENSVLMATSLGLGTRRLTVKHSDGGWKVTEDWTSLQMKPDFNDFVEYQGYVYGFDGDIFGCINLVDGKRHWKRGRYGNGQVLLLPDAGQLLVISESGEVVLINADPSKLIEVAKFRAIEGKTWNHPVLVGNRLYVRNAEEVACYELPLSPASALSDGTQATGK